MLEKLNELLNEIDCRIADGAASNGHLNYVQKRLSDILASSACGCKRAQLTDGEIEMAAREAVEKNGMIKPLYAFELGARWARNAESEVSA